MVRTNTASRIERKLRDGQVTLKRCVRNPFFVPNDAFEGGKRGSSKNDIVRTQLRNEIARAIWGQSIEVKYLDFLTKFDFEGVV